MGRVDCLLYCLDWRLSFCVFLGIFAMFTISAHFLVIFWIYSYMYKVSLGSTGQFSCLQLLTFFVFWAFLAICGNFGTFEDSVEIWQMMAIAGVAIC